MSYVREIPHPLHAINTIIMAVVVPVLGIGIPIISGILTFSLYNAAQLILSFTYFILVSYIVWRGNVYFFQKIRQRYERKKDNYFSVVATYISINMVYSGIVSLGMILAWALFSNEKPVPFKQVGTASVMVMIAVIIVNNYYELVVLKHEMEETLSKAQVMETAKMQAELESLKSQIDPHFIFNSLNTLSYLITNKPETAKMYNETLAKVYRYILIYKDEDLVFLKDELEFISNYFYLLKIRHGNAINMIIEIPDMMSENYLITPVSLQILVENAIKHNYFTTTDPMTIQIGVHASFVTVKNKVRPKPFHENVTGTGLNNLKNRYQIITQKYITVTEENNQFVVNIPILKA